MKRQYLLLVALCTPLVAVAGYYKKETKMATRESAEQEDCWCWCQISGKWRKRNENDAPKLVEGVVMCAPRDEAKWKKEGKPRIPKPKPGMKICKPGKKIKAAKKY